jgi:hypothetical protein
LAQTECAHLVGEDSREAAAGAALLERFPAEAEGGRWDALAEALPALAHQHEQLLTRNHRQCAGDEAAGAALFIL